MLTGLQDSAYLKHGQEQVLFSTFILISVDGEHHGLKEGVDLDHRDQTAQVCDVARLGLKEEEEIAILLGLLVVGEESFLQIGSIFEMASYFVLLNIYQHEAFRGGTPAHTSSNAIRFWISSAILESRYLTSFSNTKFFFDW